MTVAELIEELKALPPDREVHFAYNYGDHWHTTVAPKVTEVREEWVRHSAYHDMDKVLDEDDEKRNDDCTVVVVS